MNIQQKALSVSVSLACKDLSDMELAALYNAVNFPGYDVKQLCCYDKVAYLFTEQDGTRMHEEAIRALGVIVHQRLA